MLDLLLGAVLVALAVRGWWRGLLREAIGLAVLVVGMVLAFRMSTPVGEVVEALAGVPPEVGRLIAGVLIFLTIAIAAAVVSRLAHKGLRVVPGLPTVNRAAGAGFAVVATLAVATLAISIASVSSPAPFVADQIERSSLGAFLTDPDGPPQKALGVLSGDRVIERLLNLRDQVGSERVVSGDEVIQLAPVAMEDVDVEAGPHAEILDMLNRERAAASADPLVVSEPLARLAEAHAVDVYTTGRFGRPSPDGASFEERLGAAEIPVVVADQVMALAVSPAAAQEALFDVDSERSVLTDPAFRKVGLALVNGPSGVILVEVLAG